MELPSLLRSKMKAARKRRALWLWVLDLSRLLATADGRAVFWTRVVHRKDVHQTTSYTCEERYPALFDLAASLAADADRILSFGCSTGEELTALRRRFPHAEIVGAELNPRSRKIAARRMAGDSLTAVVHPRSIEGCFGVIFALAVLQREPHKIAAMEVKDLSFFYPFERFDAAVRELNGMLEPNGLLFVENAHYRIEDSSVAGAFRPVSGSPLMEGPLFGPDGKILEGAIAHSIFSKRRSDRDSRS